MRCSSVISSCGVLYQELVHTKELTLIKRSNPRPIQSTRSMMSVSARPWQTQITVLYIYIQGKVESSKSIISTLSHPPELPVTRKKKKEREKPEATKRKGQHIAHLTLFTPQNHTQILNPHHLYTFGFQPFSNSSALLAFSPASRTSLSILSLALKTLLCK